MQELDNPFFASLHTRHRPIALGDGDVLRYPPQYAPFLGVAHADVEAAGALDRLLPSQDIDLQGDTPQERAPRESAPQESAPQESVYLLGIAPQLSSAWRLDAFPDLAQMVCAAPIPVPDGPEVIALDATHRADVLALTALVYPHYFRERTMDMGRYFGIYREGRLAAIIGERLGWPAAQEVSAVCTHPDFTGHGYARRLLALLTNDILAQGRQPFLHVSHANARAKTLYEQMGYTVRRDIGFWSLRRA